MKNAKFVISSIANEYSISSEVINKNKEFHRSVFLSKSISLLTIIARHLTKYPAPTGLTLS